MLDVHEDFLGFYKIPSIASETVVSVHKGYINQTPIVFPVL